MSNTSLKKIFLEVLEKYEPIIPVSNDIDKQFEELYDESMRLSEMLERKIKKLKTLYSYNNKEEYIKELQEVIKTLESVNKLN